MDDDFADLGIRAHRLRSGCASSPVRSTQWPGAVLCRSCWTWIVEPPAEEVAPPKRQEITLPMTSPAVLRPAAERQRMEFDPKTIATLD